MFSVIYITSLNRVMVNILHFLPHHFIVLDQLRMYALLPKLIGTITFMFFFVKSKLIQNLLDVIFGKMLNNLFCCIGFEASNIPIQRRALQNQMTMIFQNDVSIDNQTFFSDES